MTFSCYLRRKLLDHVLCRDIVVRCMAEELTKHSGHCTGFVVMPNHVHAMVFFESPDSLSPFMKLWKQRYSVQIKKVLRENLNHYESKIDLNDPVWQRKYYTFNVFSETKLREKLNYMHNNPVASGLVETPESWKHSSARWYKLNEDVGVKIDWPA